MVTMNNGTVCLDLNECRPIDDIEDVINWKKPVVGWATLVKKLKKRTDYCSNSYPACSANCRPNFVKADSVPKTLVCHDMKGGYLADK